jgi:hypothetical protein
MSCVVSINLLACEGSSIVIRIEYCRHQVLQVNFVGPCGARFAIDERTVWQICEGRIYRAKLIDTRRGYKKIAPATRESIRLRGQ